MRVVAPVVLVVLVVFAGCGGVFGGEETTTLTPAAVPTDEPTATPVPRLAPGLTRAGVTNASALAAAHDGALDGRSFTVRRTRTYRTDAGITVRKLTSVTHVASDGRFRVTKRWAGETTLRRETSYFDGERLLVATTDAANETRYRHASAANVTTTVGTGAERIERVFTAAETRVVRSERNGTRIYRLAPVAEGRSNGSVLNQSVEVHAWVTSRGLVRRYTLDQRLSDRKSSDVSAIVVATQYGEIGATSVERPAWYERALAETNATA